MKALTACGKCGDNSGMLILDWLGHTEYAQHPWGCVHTLSGLGRFELLKARLHLTLWTYMHAMKQGSKS